MSFTDKQTVRPDASHLRLNGGGGAAAVAGPEGGPLVVTLHIDPRRALQIALGLVWMLDGALQCQSFMFHKTFVTRILEPNAAGEPGVIAQPIHWMSQLVEPHVAVFNSMAAIIELAIGAGMIYRPTFKPALIASCAWAFGIWWFGEGFGGLFAGTASPLAGAPGAVLLYPIVGMIAWPVERAGGAGGLLGVRGSRAVWAALWVIASVLWLIPANSAADATHATIEAAPAGAHWLLSLQHSLASASAGDGLAIALAMAALSGAIAVSVLLDWHARAFLVLACALALVYWVAGEGLGGIFTGTATDPGAGPPFVLLACALYLVSLQHERSRAPSARRPVVTGA